MVVFENKAVLKLLLVCLFVQFSVSATNFFQPFNVTYDHRALIIDGKRRMLISGGIHYPRATPQVPFSPFDSSNHFSTLNGVIFLSIFFFQFLNFLCFPDLGFAFQVGRSSFLTVVELEF